MNKQELIKKIEAIPYDEGVIVDKLEINRAGLIKLIEQFDEPQPLRLKDIIARMEGLSSHVRSEWLDDILCKFGSDYGVSKYQAGYEQGKFEGSLIPYKEPQKVQVPQFVADWYEENKDDFEGNLFRFINRLPAMYQDGEFSEFENWVIEAHTKPFQALVNMHQFGYEVEKEKRYYIRLKGVDENYNYLNCIKHLNAWCLTEIKKDKKFRTTHTSKQLEDADFGWVFDCPGIEIEEVME